MEHVKKAMTKFFGYFKVQSLARVYCRVQQLRTILRLKSCSNNETMEIGPTMKIRHFICFALSLLLLYFDTAIGSLVLGVIKFVFSLHFLKQISDSSFTVTASALCVIP